MPQIALSLSERCYLFSLKCETSAKTKPASKTTSVPINIMSYKCWYTNDGKGDRRLSETTLITLYWNGQLVCTPAIGLYLCVFLCVHVTSNVELRNYVISRQIVIERRVT